MASPPPLAAMNPILAFCCCGSRMCSICCTIWCIFGFIITGFLAIVAESDKLYVLVGVLNETHVDTASASFTGSGALTHDFVGLLVGLCACLLAPPWPRIK